MVDELVNGKFLRTMRAGVADSLVVVNLNMLIHITLLTESHSAVLNWTDKRFFLSVSPHMVKKIMPFSK